MSLTQSSDSGATNTSNASPACAEPRIVREWSALAAYTIDNGPLFLWQGWHLLTSHAVELIRLPERGEHWK